MAEVFHLGLDKSMLNGAELAIIPGDPHRVGRIASLLDDARPLASVREFTSQLGYIDQKPVVVCSTGIGGPSTSIAVEELAQLGVKTFLRVGTTGAIQPDISIGDLVVTTAAVRLDGASGHFAPMQFPAVSDHFCTHALIEAGEAKGVKTHAGVTASSDTFYPGQERYDTRTGWVRRKYRDSVAEWQAMGVLNFEMESATLMTMCSTQGLRSGCISGVIVNRCHDEIPNPKQIDGVEQTMVSAVVEGARRLLQGS